MRRALLLLAALTWAVLAIADTSQLSGGFSPAKRPRKLTGGSNWPPKSPVDSTPLLGAGTTCPAWSAVSLAAIWAGCAPGPAIITCADDIYLNATCGGGAPINYGYWYALAGSGQVQAWTFDAITGELVSVTTQVNGAQFADCRAAIVTNCP